MRNAAFFILLLAMSLFGALCWAGNRVGNGGNLVVCGRKTETAKIQLLDFYEKFGMDFMPAVEGRVAKEILNNKLKTLSRMA